MSFYVPIAQVGVFCGEPQSFSAVSLEPFGRDEVTAAEEEDYFDLKPRCQGYVTVEFRVPPPLGAAAAKAAAAGKLDGDYRRVKTVAETFTTSAGCSSATTREILVPLTSECPNRVPCTPAPHVRLLQTRVLRLTNHFHADYQWPSSPCRRTIHFS